MVLAGTSLARRRVQLQETVPLEDRLDRLLRAPAERGSPEVGVDRHARGIDRPYERGTAVTRHPLRALVDDPLGGPRILGGYF